MVHGCRRDEEIEIGNELPSTTPLGPSLSENLHNGSGKGQRIELIEKRMKF